MCTSPVIYGDINSDGNFNIKDVVLLKKWLLGVSDVKINDWKSADLCENNMLDILDLCAMKNKLLFH